MSFEEEVRRAHNQYRSRHGAAPLKLNANLSRLATEWAQYLLNTNSMQHRANSGYGENIYMASGGNLDGASAVRSWYNEVNHYNWGTSSFQGRCGHFTQVVWKDSRQLGVGYARRGNTIFVVCNYDPPGNYNNMYKQNVMPAAG